LDPKKRSEKNTQNTSYTNRPHRTMAATRSDGSRRKAIMVTQMETPRRSTQNQWLVNSHNTTAAAPAAADPTARALAEHRHAGTESRPCATKLTAKKDVVHMYLCGEG